MRIKKILNNNALIAIDDKGCEKVLMGKGIGFSKKTEGDIDSSLANQIFSLDGKDFDKDLTDIIGLIPLEYFNISKDIYELACKDLNKKINPSMIVSLADHIYYAKKRLDEGYNIPPSTLLYDMKLLYKDELELAYKAIYIINENLGIDFPKSEASYIAMHILNSEIEFSATADAIKVSKFIDEILNIMKYDLNLEFEEDTSFFYRFVSHLKYFAIRVFNDNQVEDKNVLEFLKIIDTNHPKIGRVVAKISQYITDRYNYDINDEEKLYLSMHISRLLNYKD